MELIIFLAGAVVSLLSLVLKKYFKTKPIATLAIVLVLSLVGGFAVEYIKTAGYWNSLIQILTTAGAFYAFIIKNITDGVIY